MSHIRSLVRAIVPPAAVSANRRLRERRWERQPFSAVEPFSEAYVTKRNALVAEQLRLVVAGETLDDLPLLGRLDLASVDERPVEYVWAFERLRKRSGRRLLDVGCVLNQPWCAPLLAEMFGERCYLNLTHEPLYDHDRASMLVADARNIPLPDGWFDAVTCLSSLEHVGMDNSLYTRDEAYRAADECSDLWARAEPAARELRRLARPGGQVLITVPFGRSENRGWFQVFDAERVDLLCTALGQGCHVDLFMIEADRGWRRATVEEASRTIYGDGAVAAGAVACVICEVPAES